MTPIAGRPAVRCIRNRVIDALDDAGGQKHQALNGACSLDMPPRPPLGVSDGPAAATLSCDQLADRGPGPEDTVLLREQLAAVPAVLPTLTAKEHQALLGALNGRCQQELAAELGRTAKMHKTALRRARDKLVGMSDRVAALQGRLELESPPGVGTTVVATLPISRGSAN